MRFTSNRTNNGFDDRAWPRLQVIPLGETRTIDFSSTRELVPRMSGQRHIQVIPSCPTARTHGGTLTVKGLTPGEDKIVWVRDGGFRDGVVGFRTLRFLVLEPLEIHITFNLVKDPKIDGEDTFATERRTPEVAGIVQKANDVLWPQTGIRIVERFSRPVRVDRALGKPVLLFNNDSNGNIRTLKSESDLNADVNVFFLWDLVLEAKNQRSDDVGLARGLEPEIFLDDTAKSSDEAGTALAHELLHIFQADHVASNELLMAESYVGRGEFIPSGVAKSCHHIGGAWLRARRKSR